MNDSNFRIMEMKIECSGQTAVHTNENEGMNDEVKAKRKRPSVASIRKPNIRHIVTQRPMSFKVDNDNFERLQGVKNKGRLINDLLRNYFEDTEDLPY